MFITIASRLEQFKQRCCVSAAEMDLYRQSIPGTSNVRSDESGGRLSAVRACGSMRKVSDWDSGIEELCGIVFSRRGTRYSKIEGALQLLNFSTLGKITIARVTQLTVYLNVYISCRKI